MAATEAEARSYLPLAERGVIRDLMENSVPRRYRAGTASPWLKVFKAHLRAVFQAQI